MRVSCWMWIDQFRDFDINAQSGRRRNFHHPGLAVIHYHGLAVIHYHGLAVVDYHRLAVVREAGPGRAVALAIVRHGGPGPARAYAAAALRGPGPGPDRAVSSAVPAAGNNTDASGAVNADWSDDVSVTPSDCLGVMGDRVESRRGRGLADAAVDGSFFSPMLLSPIWPGNRP